MDILFLLYLIGHLCSSGLSLSNIFMLHERMFMIYRITKLFGIMLI
jgi:hypothetical protein